MIFKGLTDLISLDPDLKSESVNPNSDFNPEPFTVDKFKQDLKKVSHDSNKGFIDRSERLNAYDIAHSCMRSVLFRLLGYTVEDYSNDWLPVVLRTTIGTACHEFIQTNYSDFTETEVYLRVPSLNISVKIDGLIGTNTLVEIKVCAYSDYAKILKTNHARPGDFNQALLYKYLLEDHITESKRQDLSGTKYFLPKHDNYNITTIQNIYLCHELFCGDYNLDKAIEISKLLKKELRSKYNKFWFIHPVTYTVNNETLKSHLTIIKEKINTANNYLQAKKLPLLTDKYVDKTKCFFCLFKKICNKYD